MICKNCGKSNRDDATECKYCGTALTQEPKARPSRTDAKNDSMEFLRKLSLILAAVALLALVLGLAGLLRGCSAANAAAEATTAAEAAKTAADAAQATADQTSQALQKALGRIEELESATEEPPAPVTTPDEPEDKTPTVRRYPATDPTTTVTAAVGADGKITALSYVDANGASVAIDPGTAGIPTNYVLNNTDDLVVYESDIDLCAACTLEVSEGYTGEVSYRWESLTSDMWTPRPDKTEQCLTVSPGYWFTTRAQYRCEITITIRDSSGTETDSVSVFTKATTYTDWEDYAETHSDEHDVYLQWSDMMKTYQ